MDIVIRVDPSTRAFWKETISGLLPDANVFLWDEDDFDSSKIDYAIVWAPPARMLASLENLRAVFSVGAGISHITDDPSVPTSLPIIRTTGDVLRQRMCEYIALHVLRIHRRLPELEAASKAKTWNWIVEPTAESKTVGIMGLGNLGAAVAKTLKGLGYSVRGLARTRKTIEGISTFVPTELDAFLSDVDILVSVLPGTGATDNILNEDTIGKLPKGAWIINVGRGSQIDDAALLSALNSDHLGGAVLDVFRKEPLPEEHAFWGHPKILITSHTASAIEAPVGGKIIANNIRKFSANEEIEDLVDREQGY